AAKRQPAKKVQPKIKSAEIVHSSDDESGEEGEVRDDEHEVKRVDSKTSPEKPRPINARSKARTSPDSSSDAPSAGTKRKEPPDPAKSIASLANKAAKTSAATGKVTPRTNTNGLSAPPSHHKSQRSPQKHDSKPSVPSLLGAARPRVASDVSNRGGIGVRHVKPGAATPQGLGITNGVRKRHDTVTSTESAVSTGSEKTRDDAKVVPRVAPKPTANVTPKVMTIGTPKVVAASRTNGAKRPAEDPPEDNAPKHRKTTSTSSQSQLSQSTSTSTVTAHSTARTSPDATAFDSGSSDSAASVLDTITYAQGVHLAEKFRDQYYPAYAAMYDAQAAREGKGEGVGREERERLWAMHRRLEQMKREIQRAGERELRGD
ncbi:hypothetical protein B0A55_13348, partial [Friedmanniomyces simplex]